MLENEKIIAALIAAYVSIIVSMVTIILTNRKFKHEYEIKAKELSNKYLEKLYELRLEKYPEAFSITENLGKQRDRSDEEVKSIIENSIEMLVNWRKDQVSLILSERSLSAYYELYDALKAKPAFQNKFSDEQIKKIWKFRNNFRTCLRHDVGNVDV